MEKGEGTFIHSYNFLEILLPHKAAAALQYIFLHICIKKFQTWGDEFINKLNTIKMKHPEMLISPLIVLML